MIRADIGQFVGLAADFRRALSPITYLAYIVIDSE